MAAFIGHSSCSKCGSSDANSLYEDGSSHCFSCGFTIPSKEYLEASAGKDSRKKSKDFKSKTQERKDIQVEDTPKNQKEVISAEDRAEIKSSSTFIAESYRGIRPEIFPIKLQMQDQV